MSFRIQLQLGEKSEIKDFSVIALLRNDKNQLTSLKIPSHL